MSKYIPGNQKHLSLEDRKYIERSLNNGTSFKDIARFLCKDPTTISKEVKLHRLSDWYHKGKQMYVARQIITNHPELDMSVRTLYSYLDNGILTARNIDLKRKVKFKPRKVHKTQIKDRTVFNGRMFTDFQSLGLDHFTEMDTVHSSQESKRVILTFFLTREKLFLAFIMNRCTKGAVRLIFDKLERQLGTYDFLTLFSTILTDRGSEFGDPEALETGTDGMIRSSIHFCDPMRSGQKGGIEQVHTLLRMVLPKKTSFEFLTQWDLRTIVDHINSTPRESLNGRTPYDVALENYGIDILKALQLRPIPPDEVNLTPKLIRFNR